MAGIHNIAQPKDQTLSIQDGGTLKLKWASNFGSKKTTAFNKAQEYIDKEVLHLCEPKVPKDTGALINSGTLSTVLGSGNVTYSAVYARYQYYREDLAHYDANRGAKWFERMKVESKESIMSGAERIISGGSA